MPRRVSESTVVVIGLGRFGTHLSKTLEKLGREVLAIERDPALVQQLAPELTLVVEADATSEETLRELGVDQVKTAVVAIGTSLEASVLATSALAEIGLVDIWAKAVTERHQKILEKVGAKHVVFPELDMGSRVAHQLLQGDASEYIEFTNGYAVAAVKAPQMLIGRTPQESRIFTFERVQCIARQRSGGGDFESVTPTTRIEAEDILVIAGKAENVEGFTLEHG